MNICKYLLIATTIIGIASCGGCNSTADKSGSVDLITEAERNIAANPSRDNIASILDKLALKAIAITGKNEQKEVLKKGFDLARAKDFNDKAVSFALPLMKAYPEDEENRDYLYFIGETMVRSKNRETGEFLLQSFIDRYPQDTRVEKARTMIQNPIMDKDAYILKIAESVFVDPDKFGINTTNAQKYVDICEAHGLAYPNDAKTPEYLYRASEISSAIRTFPKSLSLYDWLINLYPDYGKTPNALFAKGYLLEEELAKPEQSRAAFEQFLSQYPDHELADDAKFLMENIGKSGDEIIKILEETRAKKEAEVQ